MAVISEYEEEKSQNFSTTGANAEELVGPYDEVLGKILQEQSPLALMEILIDFLRRKSDLFRDDSVENRIADLVSSAKRKDAEEKKGKISVQQKAEKRLKQDEPSASTAATYSAYREAVKAPKISDDEDSGLKPNLVTYNTMLDAIGKAGRPSMAKVLNKEMIDEGLTPPSQIGTESLASRLKEQNLLRTQGLIGGKWVSAQDGKTLPVYNPATQELLANVPCMGENETKDAIASAYDAFYSWSKLTATERSKILRKWYELLIAHKEDLGLLMTLENGKPLKEGLGEVVYGASFVEFYAEEAKRIYGDIIPATLSDRRLLVLKQPVGVVGAITPWNFPLAMITRKVAPALASGCTVVVKPSELTPLTALAAAELALQAGVPPGVFNVVMGNASQIGDTLLASSQVRKITFTGSTAVGKKLMSGAAGTVKKVSLELGGNAPCIVFDDAKLEVAVKGTVAAKFRNTGQTCVCVNRVLVQDGIYEKFAKVFASAVQDMQVGNGLEEGVVQGPLITTAALQKVERHVQDAISKGAKVLSGGKRHRLGHTFYEPTVLGDASSDMLISREEVFGPVAPLFRFKTEEEAVKIANDTQFGLASYVFTESMSRIWRVAEALEYGLVGVNEGVISTEVAPFGGFKESGLGREGSKYGIDEYLEVKYVCLGNINH